MASLPPSVPLVRYPSMVVGGYGRLLVDMARVVGGYGMVIGGYGRG